MKITGSAPSRPTTSRRSAAGPRGTGGAFASELSGAPEGAAGSAGAAPAASVQALLSIQEVPDATNPAKRAARRGEDLLDRLEEIQQALLAGTLPHDRLLGLAQLVRSRREHVADPRLAEVLDEIELRCRVELAKLAAGSTAA